jgi:hypothetical protein
MAREGREITRRMRFEPLEAVKQSVVRVYATSTFLPIITVQA